MQKLQIIKNRGGGKSTAMRVRARRNGVTLVQGVSVHLRYSITLQDWEDDIKPICRQLGLNVVIKHPDVHPTICYELIFANEAEAAMFVIGYDPKEHEI